MRPEVVVPPEPVITLARAKLQCKLDGNERDDEVQDAIETARAWAQEFTQRAIGQVQTLKCTFEDWLGYAALPFIPSEIVSVTDAAGAVVSTIAGRTVTATATAPVVITFKVAGYTTTTLPGPVKSAMLLMIADLIRNPQGQVEVELYENKAVKSLLWPYRVELGT